MADGKPRFPTTFARLDLLLEDFGTGEASEVVTLEGPVVEFQVERNPYNEADTFELTVDWEDFPLDPRIVRAGTAEIHFADAEAIDELYWSRLGPEEVRATTLHIGVIDEIEGELDDQWRRTRLKGRDYTAFLLDSEPPADFVLTLKADKTLTEYVREFLDLDPPGTMKRIGIRLVEGTTDPVPFDYKSEKKREVKDGESWWDILQELAFDAGLLLYVELDEVVLRAPKELYDARSSTEEPWRWTLGSDVKAFRPRRVLARQHGVNVRVTSYTPDLPGGKLEAIHPKNPLRAEKAQVDASPVGSAEKTTSTEKEVTFSQFTVRGITDLRQLERIAEQVWEQLRHQEFEGSLETDALVDSSGRNVAAMKYGDPVVLDVQETLRSFQALTTEAQVRALQQRGYASGEAQRIAQAISFLSVPFYLHKATHRFSSEGEEGYSLEVEVRARKQVDLPEG